MAQNEAVPNLKGDAARAAFINHFKEVQRLKTQLDEYTDLTGEDAAAIEQILPEENLRGFRGQYLETAQRLKAQQGKRDDTPDTDDPVDQLDFEFVLFASAVIDYVSMDIMGPISRFSQTVWKTSQQKWRTALSCDGLERAGQPLILRVEIRLGQCRDALCLTNGALIA